MSNISRIREALRETNCDAMLVTNQISRLFATGFSSSAGALLVTESSAWFYTDSRYIEAAEAAIKDAEVILVGGNDKLTDVVCARANDISVRAIGFEDGNVSFASHKNWADKLNAEMVSAGQLLSNLRNIKSRDDLNKMIAAQCLAEKVFEETLPLINTDVTEKDIAAEIIYKLLKGGAEDKAFDPIVVSGTNSSRPHGVPGNGKIAKGFLTIDFGVKVNGWCSDTTRTLCVGKPDDEMVKIYNTVLQAQEAGIEAVRGGVSGVDVDKAARDMIDAAGYGEYFGHGFGHSLGLEVHESLSASPASKDTLPTGAVISAEPGIYIPGKYGVRIEDVLYITDTGCENITNLPKKLIVL